MRFKAITNEIIEVNIEYFKDFSFFLARKTKKKLNFKPAFIFSPICTYVLNQVHGKKFYLSCHIFIKSLVCWQSFLFPTIGLRFV